MKGNELVTEIGIRGKSSRKGKPKAKTGCRTCKIRRVKCDEQRPACHRCVTTGRTCDGYGIWGGGGNTYAERYRSCYKLKLPTPVKMFILTGTVNAQEQSSFEWFMYRTAKKLPGAFPSNFWDEVVLQASLSEPAILHASIALSSAHKRDHLRGRAYGGRGHGPDEQEVFTLQQYSRAIAHLQQHSVKHSLSVRVALITCILFTCLDLLRGCVNAGKVHLQNGRNLVRELQASSDTNWMDQGIIEVFSRLHVQAELLQMGSESDWQGLHIPTSDWQNLHTNTPELPIPTFRSASHARQHLDRIIHNISHLSEQYRQANTLISASGYYFSELLQGQQRIQAALFSWLSKISKNYLSHQSTSQDAYAYQLLHLYYTMAKIMAATCLSSDESVYDNHTNDFVILLRQAIDIWKTTTIDNSIPDEKREDTFKSISDIGFIAPLAYTAFKCRVHRVRLHVIRLLEVTGHKEGIWDAALTAVFAREVMRIEEGNYVAARDDDKEFALETPPAEGELAGERIMPRVGRVYCMKAVLPDDFAGEVTLMCRRKDEDGNSQRIVRKYNVLRRCWND